MERAKKAGIKYPNPQHLDGMAQEKNGLLREIKPTSSGSDVQYSLGHDALAPALLRWRLKKEGTDAEKRRARRQTGIFASAAALFMVALSVLFLVLFIQRSERVDSLYASAKSDLTPYFRHRIFLLTEALAESQGILWSHVLHEDEVRESLIKTILRAPILLGESDAIGISPSGPNLAILDRDGSVWVHDLLNTTNKRKIGRIEDRVDGAHVESNQDLPQTPAIGFIKGLELPVVYKDGKLYWWEDEQKDGSPPSQIELSTLMDKSTADRAWRSIVISGGTLRLVETSPRQKAVFSRFDRTPEGFARRGEPVTILYPPPFSPVYSNDSDLLAYLKNSRIVVAHRDVASAPGEFEIAHSEVEPKTLSPGPQQTSLQQSVAFANTDNAIVRRESPSGFVVIDLTKPASSGAPHLINIPAILRDPPVPQMMGFLRPALAATQVGDSWRLAWPGNNGISLMQDEHKTLPWAYRTNSDTLLPATSLDSITQLNFGNGGRLLILLRQSGWRSPVGYRIWDLSQERRSALSALTDDALRQQACRIALLEPFHESDDDSLKRCARTP
jgi:hypothetical protein